MAGNYYYVKTGGTATGTGGMYTSAKANNSWATEFTATSQYYDTLHDCIENGTTNPGAGDFVLVSDQYANVATPPNDINFQGGLNNGLGLYVMSVDDTAIQTYKPGASEDVGGTSWEWRFEGNGLVAGFTLRTGDNSLQSSNDETVWTFRDMDIKLEGALDNVFYLLNDGSQFTLENCWVEPIASNITQGWITVARGCVLKWKGGGILTTGNAMNTELVASLADGGGAQLYFENLDLSNTTSGCLMHPEAAGPNTNHAIIWEYKNCKFNAAAAIKPTPITHLCSEHHHYTISNCSDTTDNNSQYFYYATKTGSLESNQSVYVTGSSVFDGEAKASLQFKTSTGISPASPFVYKPFKQYIELGTDATSKIIIHLVTDATLTDGDLYARLYYMDGTNELDSNFVTSSGAVPSGSIHPGLFSADTSSLTNDATYGKAIGDWTGATGLTPYTLVLDTAGDVGKDQICEIEIVCMKDFTTASDVLYFSSEIELGT